MNTLTTQWLMDGKYIHNRLPALDCCWQKLLRPHLYHWMAWSVAAAAAAVKDMEVAIQGQPLSKGLHVNISNKHFKK